MASLELPGSLDGVLDQLTIAGRKIHNDHHVTRVSPRDAEGQRIVAKQRVAVVEAGADHEAAIIELARNEPAVVPPLDQPVVPATAHALQCFGAVSDVVQSHPLLG